jgi:hypothetical protein
MGSQRPHHHLRRRRTSEEVKAKNLSEEEEPPFDPLFLKPLFNPRMFFFEEITAGEAPTANVLKMEKYLHTFTRKPGLSHGS